MFKKEKLERCKHCRKFLTDEQKRADRTLCLDCADSVLAGIKKSFRIRAVLGVLCIALVFAFIHYMRMNAFEYGEGVLRVIRVPTVFGYLTYRPAAFENIMNFSFVQQIMLGAVVFTIPFAKRVRFGMDSYYTFSMQYTSKSHTSDHPYLITQAASRGSGDRLGLLISELLLTLVSGPYFFIHGAVTMWKMKRYVEGRPN